MICNPAYDMEVDYKSINAIHNWANENRFFCPEGIDDGKGTFSDSVYIQYQTVAQILGCLLLPLADIYGRKKLYYFAIFIHTFVMLIFLWLGSSLEVFYWFLAIAAFTLPAHCLLSFIYCLEFIASKSFDFLAMAFILSGVLNGLLIDILIFSL